MAKFQKQLTKVGGSILDEILPRRKIVCLKLRLKDGLEKLILNLQNLYYLPKSPWNFMILRLFNDNSVFDTNKRKNLYKVISKRILA